MSFPWKSEKEKSLFYRQSSEQSNNTSLAPSSAKSNESLIQHSSSTQALRPDFSLNLNKKPSLNSLSFGSNNNNKPVVQLTGINSLQPTLLTPARSHNNLNGSKSTSTKPIGIFSSSLSTKDLQSKLNNFKAILDSENNSKVNLEVSNNGKFSILG